MTHNKFDGFCNGNHVWSKNCIVNCTKRHELFLQEESGM